MLVDYALIDIAIAFHPEWTKEEINAIYEDISMSLDKESNIEVRKAAADRVNEKTELLAIDLTFRS